MNRSRKGAFFEFDDSILVENTKLHIPLSISRNESSSTHFLKNELLNLYNLNFVSATTSSNTSSLFTSNNSTISTNTANNASLLTSTANNASTPTNYSYKAYEGSANAARDNERITKWFDRNRDEYRRVYDVLLDETLRELKRIDKEREDFKKKQSLIAQSNKLTTSIVNSELKDSTPVTTTVNNQLATVNKELLVPTTTTTNDNQLLVPSTTNIVTNEPKNESIDKNWLIRLIELNGIDLGRFDFVPRESKSLKLFGQLRERFTQIETTVNAIANDGALKPVRIEILKSLTKCVNSLANTRRQIGLVLQLIVALINRFNQPQLTVFIVFKLVEKVLNCCEEGNQIYITQHTSWTYSKLLYYLSNSSVISSVSNSFIGNSTGNNSFTTTNNTNNTNNNGNNDKDLVFVVLVNLLLDKCLLIIPIFFLTSRNNSLINNSSADNTLFGGNTSTNRDNMGDISHLKELNELYTNNSTLNDDVKYNKRMSSYLSLYFSFLTLRNDFGLIWSYYSTFVNSSWERVFHPVVPCLAVTLLKTTSHFMLTIFKSQFQKVLNNVKEMISLKLLPHSSFNSSVDMYLGQLQQFYQSYYASGVIDEPEGYSTKYKEEELRDDI